MFKGLNICRPNTVDTVASTILTYSDIIHVFVIYIFKLVFLGMGTNERCLLNRDKSNVLAD